MSTLAAAVEASQDAAIKALGKRFVRSEDEPDPDAYRAQLHALGFLDDVGISFMLTGWQILRHEKAQAPHPVASRAARHEAEPATDAQWQHDRARGGEDYPWRVYGIECER